MAPDVARGLRPLAWANLAANIGIVITGGAVRLTASGLGCPTWPRCTEDSFVPHGELGVHGTIEFGNRLLTWVLVAIAIACWVAAMAPVLRARAAGSRAAERHRRAALLATLIALGIPAQGVIGGITVLTDLNPYVVALHLLVSMAIIAACVLLLDAVRGPARPAAPPGLRRITWLVLAQGWVVLWLGTVVTGSGPHSGDLDSRRTGLDPQLMSHVHAAAVYVLVALTVLTLALAWRAGATPTFRAAVALLAIELLQGAVGFAQYFNDLPELLVGVHLLGAALTSAALAWLVQSARARAREVTGPRAAIRLDEAPPRGG